MESTYITSRFHDYEISNSISLRQNDPLALLRLRENGSAEFSIPEILFDFDFPGPRSLSKEVEIGVGVGPLHKRKLHAEACEAQVQDTRDGAR